MDLTILPHSCSDCLGNLGNPTSRSKGLSRPVQVVSQYQLIFTLLLRMRAVAACYKVCPDFYRSNTGIVGSNLASLMNVCRQLLCTRIILCGPGSSVGIATDYWLDGPGSNPGGDEIFRQSRPTLGPTQPPV